MNRAISLLAVALLFASCGSKTPTASAPPNATPAPAASSNVSVRLVEWSIVPNATVGKAGKITFAVTNPGKVGHEFVIFKTDVSPFSLPTKPDGSVDEEKLNDVGEGGDLKPGESKTSTFDLPSGKYVFICNHVDKKSDGKSDVHYQLGMRTAFTVQ
jgi:uncharacterized cupredoxin-like copper-binding protein